MGRFPAPGSCPHQLNVAHRDPAPKSVLVSPMTTKARKGWNRALRGQQTQHSNADSKDGLEFVKVIQPSRQRSDVRSEQRAFAQQVQEVL